MSAQPEQVLDKDIAVLFALILMILLTGAFHEDAFADFCDGFGGGYTKEKILSIMKDSRIGTYGAIGICMLLLAKYVLLTRLEKDDIPVLIIAAHAFSRFLAVSLIFTSQYIGNKDESKSKPVGEKNTPLTFILAFLFGMVPLLMLDVKFIVFILIIQSFIFLYFRYYVHKRIKGYTGDVLGALQQLSETAFYFFYLIFLAISWKFIC